MKCSKCGRQPYGDNFICDSCREGEYDDYDEDDDDYMWTAEDEEERQYEEDCERAATCVCGAWQFSKSRKPIHVADCICGAE